MPYYDSEVDRPCEWMRAFEEGDRSYADLIDQSAGMAAAAYRVARALGRMQAVPTNIPTAAELYAAAERIAVALRGETALPSRALLVDACEFAGLPLITPRVVNRRPTER